VIPARVFSYHFCRSEFCWREALFPRGAEGCFFFPERPGLHFQCGALAQPFFPNAFPMFEGCGAGSPAGAGSEGDELSDNSSPPEELRVSPPAIPPLSRKTSATCNLCCTHNLSPHFCRNDLPPLCAFFQTFLAMSAICLTNEEDRPRWFLSPFEATISPRLPLCARIFSCAAAE